MKAGTALVGTAVGHDVRSGPPLQLLRQARLAPLIEPVAPDLRRLEASGVVLVDGLLWMIFDNLSHLVAIDPALTVGPPPARVVRQPGPPPGYEDVAYDEHTGRRFALIESARTSQGGFRPQIDEYDAAWLRISRRWVELDLDRANKGLEGLTCVSREGRGHLLALSEGNRNQGGRRGRRPGGGRLHLLQESGPVWTVREQIRLPADLPFVDYSAVSVHGDRIAVVSQQSSALWVGRLKRDSWQVAGAGQVHPFPRNHRGRQLYGTVEGVSWLDERTVAVVSDRAKRGQPRRLRATAESVQVFVLPEDESEA
jgi:hypothetical protein